MTRSGWKTGMNLLREREAVNDFSSDGRDSVEIDPTQPLTFSPSDVLYLGELLLNNNSEDIRQNLNITLAKEVRSEISNLVNRLRIKGVTTEGYFESEGMDRMTGIVTRFGELDLSERQTCLENNPDIAPVLQPLSHLSKDNLGFWHRLSHNGLALHGQFSS